MGSVRFSLSSVGQIRHFRIALQALAKIGADLLIEAVPNELVLRVINSSKSAFFAISFSSVFFDTYEVHQSQVVQSAVLIKSNMLSFCHVPELTKVYNLECTNQDILNATVDKSSLPTTVVAEAGELNRLLASFQVGLEEITIIANPESSASVANGHSTCQLQSFFDPEKAQSEGALHTSLALDTRSLFLSYTHNSDVPSDVTFNVKDFKTFVSLCEHMGANITIRFDQPGVPLVAEPHFRGVGGEVDYRPELVLATLMESQYNAQASLLQIAEEESPLAAPGPGSRPPSACGAAGASPLRDRNGVTDGVGGPAFIRFDSAGGPSPRGYGGDSRSRSPQQSAPPYGGGPSPNGQAYDAMVGVRGINLGQGSGLTAEAVRQQRKRQYDDQASLLDPDPEELPRMRSPRQTAVGQEPAAPEELSLNPDLDEDDMDEELPPTPEDESQLPPTPDEQGAAKSFGAGIIDL
eukprot:gene16936-23209_t